MARRDPLPAELQSTRLARLRHVQRLSTDRSGHASVEHVRHQLYVGHDRETNSRALLKVTTRPGIVYEQNLVNEAAVLSTINRDLPASRHFPLLLDHGRLPHGRMFVLMSFFDEWPLATAIGPERRPDRLVGHLRTSIAVGAALAALHRIGIFHVDLNPMNVLYRSDGSGPVIRIVDFESAYEVARHGSGGVFYNPPRTTGFSAPELPEHAPDARSDVFSLGAVLYTMIAGYEWTWGGEVSACITSDDIDSDLRSLLLRAVDGEPTRRHQSIEELCTALTAYLESIWPGRSATP